MPHQARQNLAGQFNLAQHSLAVNNGDIAAVMKDLEAYATCKGCTSDGHRYVEFIMDASNQVALTVMTGGVAHVIKGAEAAQYLDIMRKMANNEKAVAFVINGGANATISAVANEQERTAGSIAYNTVVGGKAASF